MKYLKFTVFVVLVIVLFVGLYYVIKPSVVSEYEVNPFTIKPSSDYKIKSLKVDGVENTGIYTKNLKRDHSISIEFEKTEKFHITTSSEKGGVISPAGISLVEEGGMIFFRFDANTGYKLSKFIVNGEEKNILTILNNKNNHKNDYDYVIKNIREDYTILLKWAKI